MCQPIRLLPNSSKLRDPALAALCSFIGSSKEAIFGLDFPPGIPHQLVQDSDWRSFINSFPNRYPDCDRFRKICTQAALGRELKRATDLESATPHSAYNLRLYKQTYYGIRSVVGPLVTTGIACLLPMQDPEDDKPWLVEVCPASTLKRAGLYISYKGSSNTCLENRKTILRGLKEIAPYALLISESVVLKDKGGDALDSFIAALATFRAYRQGKLQRTNTHPFTIEGFVYI